MAKRGKRIDPRFDAEQVPALLGDRQPSLPQIIAEKRHGHAMPAPTVGLTPIEHHRQAVMAIGINLTADLDPFTDHRLDRKQAAVQNRQRILDHDPRFQQRLGQADRLVWMVVCRGCAVGFEGLIAGHRS